MKSEKAMMGVSGSSTHREIVFKAKLEYTLHSRKLFLVALKLFQVLRYLNQYSGLKEVAYHISDASIQKTMSRLFQCLVNTRNL